MQRNFQAAGPNRLWVVDFTYVATWERMAYTAFVHDVCSHRIVGWRTGSQYTSAEFARWIEGWYNPRRLHSTIDHLTPDRKGACMEHC